ncbi:hypothetical protein JCM11491_001234 [Sporobolomyces phaffii]
MSTEMNALSLTLIVAATRSNAIGCDSSLPWRLSKEMAYFARMTKGEQTERPGADERNAVIMGRKSWEGIPAKFRPLADRTNVVVSRQSNYDLNGSPATHLAHSLESAVELLRTPSSSLECPRPRRTFLIGGAQLYNEALNSPASSSPAKPYSVDRVLLTRILTDYPDCDTFLSPFSDDATRWRRASHEELVDWAGWDVPSGIQREKDRMVRGDVEKFVEYEYQLWVRP